MSSYSWKFRGGRGYWNLQSGLQRKSGDWVEEGVRKEGAGERRKGWKRKQKGVGRRTGGREGARKGGRS